MFRLILYAFTGLAVGWFVGQCVWAGWAFGNGTLMMSMTEYERRKTELQLTYYAMRAGTATFVALLSAAYFTHLVALIPSAGASISGESR
jgi:hypothetical protein